jgi:hypothetical protein
MYMTRVIFLNLCPIRPLFAHHRSPVAGSEGLIVYFKKHRHLNQLAAAFQTNPKIQINKEGRGGGHSERDSLFQSQPFNALNKGGGQY